MAPSLPSLFPSTRWTLIRSAQSSPQARRAAMETLLHSYWRPLYVFIRKKGLDAQAAEDAVQDLMAQLIERDFVSKADPAKGKLRSYLMASATNALANRHEAATAKRRGGGQIAIPLDVKLAEQIVSTDGHAPDEAFDREWAVGIMDRALQKLAAEFESGERAGPFALVTQMFHPEIAAPPSYKTLAAQHGMSLPQLKSFLHRARTRFKALVRDEIADTVDTPDDVDAELAQLVAVLQR